MKLSQIPILVLLASISFVHMGCKEEPLQPVEISIDTRSHNFSWQTFVFGGGASSYINDVKVISDSNIWAFGTIRLSEFDSLGNSVVNEYSAMYWNGKEWSPFLITYNGSLRLIEIRSVFIAGPNDIWIAAGSIFHWDGVSHTAQLSYSRFDFPAEGDQPLFTKLWGLSSKEIYAAGTAGALVYYNGSSWMKIPTGVAIDFTDIYGGVNKKTSTYELFLLGGNYNQLPFTSKLFQITNHTVSSVADLPGVFLSVWSDPGAKYYLGGDSLIWKDALNKPQWEGYPRGKIFTYGIASIRGEGNDLFIAGAYFEVAHFNGASWKNYKSELVQRNGVIRCIEKKGSTVVFGGYENQNAVLLIGHR